MTQNEKRLRLARQKARMHRKRQQEALKKRDEAPPPTQHVPPRYKGATAFCFATGPSLVQEQVELVKTLHESGKVLAFGLNDAYRIVPYLDVLYACDPKWWDVHMEQEDHKQHNLVDYPAEKWTQDGKASTKFKINRIPGKGNKGFGDRIIHFGSNSGYQLLNLAYLFGVARMFLLGYDMQVPEGAQQHFFGPHPKPLSRGCHYKNFAKQFETIQPEIKKTIINCTPTTALKAFERRELVDVLEELKRET